MGDKVKEKEKISDELASLRQQLYEAREIIRKISQEVEVLKKDKEKLQNYLDNSGVIIITINSDHTIAFINKKGCELLGYSDREIVKKDFFTTLIPKGTRFKLRKQFNRLMEGRLELIGKQTEITVI